MRRPLPQFFYLIGCLCCGISCNNSSSADQKTSAKGDTLQIKETKANENFYPKLRAMVFSVTADTLHLDLDKTKTIVYGVVMDWNMGDVVVSVVAFQTGDASLYLSTGQIYIGGSGHENTKKAGLAFVNEAQNYLSKANPTETTALPDKDCVRFYFLTNKGKYTFQETVREIEHSQSEWTKLFAAGNDVITEYRKTVPAK